jgi:hypothetical protein
MSSMRGVPAVFPLPRERSGEATLALGLVGMALVVLAMVGPFSILGVHVAGSSQPARALLAASVFALLVTALCMRTEADRIGLVATGLAGLGGVALLVMAASPLLTGIVLLLVLGVYISRPTPQPLIERLRNPGAAAVLLGVSAILSTIKSDPAYGEVASLTLVLGIVAVAGLVPYLHRYQPEQATASSGLAWSALVAPALAVAVLTQEVPHLHGQGKGVFSGLCVVIGLVNVAYGLFGAWQAPARAETWRHSFLAEWGLALCAFGLLLPDHHGSEAAYLLLISLVTVRFPLYMLARGSVQGGETGRWAPLNLLSGLALAGVAPFVGFAARLLLLGAAMEVAWPLALVLMLAMVAFVSHSFRLGASLAVPRGRAVVGLILILALAAAMGIAPGLVLSLGGY